MKSSGSSGLPPGSRFCSCPIGVHHDTMLGTVAQMVGNYFTESRWEEALIYSLDGIMNVFLPRRNSSGLVFLVAHSTKTKQPDFHRAAFFIFLVYFFPLWYLFLFLKLFICIFFLSQNPLYTNFLVSSPAPRRRAHALVVF